MSRASVLCLALAAVLASALPTNAEGPRPEPVARSLDFACPAGGVQEDGFSDVPAGSTHEPAVDCVVHWQVANGTTSSSYEPARAVNRGQMASFIRRLVERTGGQLAAPSRDWFDDDDGTTHEESVNLLAEARIVGGTGDRTYAPASEVSRAQMAAFLTRAYDHRAEQADRPALPAGGDYFADDDGQPLEPQINAAAAAGFAGGTGGGLYSPTSTARRDQMGSFLARVLDLLVERGVTEVPPPPPPRPRERLAPPPPHPGGAGGYAFAAMQPHDADEPITFDPCAPVTWVVRRSGEVPGGDALLERVADVVERATGLVLVRGPDTDEPPADSGFQRDPARYGGGQLPVLVTWSDETESPALAGSTAGRGGGQTWVSDRTGTMHFQTAQVTLDRVDLQRWLDLGYPGAVEELVLHEFGHMIGLDHVDDPAHVMHPWVDVRRPQTLLSDGDRRGLYEVGTGTCAVR